MGKRVGFGAGWGFHYLAQYTPMDQSLSHSGGSLTVFNARVYLCFFGGMFVDYFNVSKDLKIK